jgi:hypothetical protein
MCIYIYIHMPNCSFLGHCIYIYIIHLETFLGVIYTDVNMAPHVYLYMVHLSFEGYIHITYIYIHTNTPYVEPTMNRGMLPNPCGASGHIQWPGSAFFEGLRGTWTAWQPTVLFLGLNTIWVEDQLDFLA